MKPKDDHKIFVPERTEDHVDPMRSMSAEGLGEKYHSYGTLAEASANGGHVILQGDDGGQIYFTCPATRIKCSEVGLKKLLNYLDAHSWNDASSARIYYEDCQDRAGVAGGMGGGLAIDDVWLHPKLQRLGLEANVRSFVAGLTADL